MFPTKVRGAIGTLLSTRELLNFKLVPTARTNILQLVVGGVEQEEALNGEHERSHSAHLPRTEAMDSVLRSPEISGYVPHVVAGTVEIPPGARSSRVSQTPRTGKPQMESNEKPYSSTQTPSIN